MERGRAQFNDGRVKSLTPLSSVAATETTHPSIPSQQSQHEGPGMHNRIGLLIETMFAQEFVTLTPTMHPLAVASSCRACVPEQSMVMREAPPWIETPNGSFGAEPALVHVNVATISVWRAPTLC